MNAFLDWLAPAGVQSLFVSWAVQGALLGLCVLAGLAVSGRVRKAFGFGWLCRQWLLMALLFLVPVQQAAQAVSSGFTDDIRANVEQMMVPKELEHVQKS